MIPKKAIKRQISLLITIIACLYLVWKLYFYTDYQLLWETLHLHSSQQKIALLALISLAPLNLIFESEKWRFLIRNIQSLSFKEAFLNILYGQVGAFITPNRLGEYPSRSMAFPASKRTPMITMGFIGSGIQTLLFIVIGIIALTYQYILTPKQQIFQDTYIYLIIGLSILGILLLIFLPTIGKWLANSRFKIIQNIASQFTQIGSTELSIISLWTLLRYAVFAHQFYLALICCGIYIPYASAMISIAQMYLFITITPSISTAIVPIRTSFAILVLKPFTDLYPNILLASFIIWIINSILPLTIGAFLFNKHQK